MALSSRSEETLTKAVYTEQRESCKGKPSFAKRPRNPVSTTVPEDTEHYSLLIGKEEEPRSPDAALGRAKLYKGQASELLSAHRAKF